MTMKIALTTEQDIRAAQDVLSALEALDSGYFPESWNEGEEFFCDDAEHCLFAMNRLLDAAGNGNTMRFLMNAVTLLDTKNNVVNPDSDILELHPRIEKALAMLDEQEKKACEETP